VKRLLPLVCSWCGAHMGGPKPTPQDKHRSHGICETCKAKHLSVAPRA